MNLIFWLLLGAAAGLLVPTALALFRPSVASGNDARGRKAAPSVDSSRRTRRETAAARSPYHSVSIVTGIDRCDAAITLTGQRFLPDEAPALPVPGCDRSGECRCRYRRHDDRRSDDERRLGFDTYTGFGLQSATNERRARTNRREPD